jgi:hypothetical protein
VSLDQQKKQNKTLAKRILPTKQNFRPAKYL